MGKQLTKAEMRVAILKDVIKQVNTGKYVAYTGIYMSISDSKLTKDFYDYAGKQFKALIPKINRCRVCQMGGLFMSCVKIYNDLKVDQADNRDGINKHRMKTKLLKYFSKKQLSLMESAFERQSVAELNAGINEYDPEWKEEIIEAVKFGRSYDTNEARLVAICSNGIKNKGTFKP
jgi:hypothetical protein